MNLYEEWVKENIDNPNRCHVLDWIDNETILIVGYDKRTRKGAQAIFKMRDCEKFDQFLCSSPSENKKNFTLGYGQKEDND